MCDSCDSSINCRNCTKGFALQRSTIGKSNANYCTLACSNFGQYIDNRTQACENCPIACNFCSNATNCTQCNKFTTLNTTDGQCYCNFNYEIRSIGNGSFVVDTYNLAFTRDVLSKTQPCSRVFEFTADKTFPIAETNKLQCTVTAINNSFPVNQTLSSIRYTDFDL